MNRTRTHLGLFVMTLLLPSLALAHVTPGLHEHGFAAGFAHPLTGLDHLAAMISIGIWSALTARRWWLAPLAFAAMVLLGALLSGAGAKLAGTETVIALSLVALGALVATRSRWPAWAMTSLASGFALFHGAAHGQELAGAAALAGMVLATALLHVAGLAVGFAAARAHPAWARMGGVAIGLFGASLVLGLA